MGRRVIQLTVSTTLAIKLARIIVSAEELVRGRGHSFDVEAIETLLDDSEVSEWLDTFDPALLPFPTIRKAPL